MPTPQNQSIARIPGSNVKDITDKRFGKLLVVSRFGKTKAGKVTWYCLCECGKSCVAIGSALLSGHKTSCGDHPKVYVVKDLVGQRFGRLLVVSQAGKSADGHSTWNCVCDSGEQCVVIGRNLLTGNTTSCGCYGRERLEASVTTHGHSKGLTKGLRPSKVYSVWCSMVQRCTNPKCRGWRYYGSRGIRICDSWLKFENFYRDMGDPPKGRSIDRTDVNGNYEKSNCTWATNREQALNRRVLKTKTGVRGVCIQGNRYMSQATIRGVHHFLGTYPMTPEGLKAAGEVFKRAKQIDEILS